MINILKILTICSIVVFAGCGIVDKLVEPVNQPDGTVKYEATEIGETAADTIPYGHTALNILLIALTGITKWKQHKTEKGLKSTVVALKKISKDPELEEQWEEIKKSLKYEHEKANVIDLIKMMIAKS